MKKNQTISGDIVPLSRRQNIVIFVIVACIFQFALFYSPALAEDAVKKTNQISAENDDMVFNGFIIKDKAINQEAAKFAKPVSTAVSTSSIEDAVANKKTISKASSTPTVKVISTSVHVMTAYNSEPGQTDDSPCITANGFNVCKSGVEDTIAANFLKMGTKVRIPELFGNRIFTVRDRMNQRHATRVDVWMVSKSDAIKFGVKKAKIEVVEIIDPETLISKK